jgi:DNA processing protein
LIREGAKLTQSVEDVLEEIAPQLAPRARSVSIAVSDEEMQVLRAVGSETEHVDTVILRTAMPAQRVLQLLLGLELKGLIEQLPGKYFLATGVDQRLIRAQE